MGDPGVGADPEIAERGSNPRGRLRAGGRPAGPNRLCSPRRLVGLDFDGELLAEAAEHLRECGTEAELRCGDVRRLPFDDGAFDVIIDFGTLYHIAGPGTALGEIARVLVPGGSFVYETKASQFLSHPVRSRGRRLPPPAPHGLRHRRWAMLWASRTKAPLS